MRGSAGACGSARNPTGVLATVTAVVALMLVPMAGQAQTAAADTVTAPRTPWGDPDLQGQIRTTGCTCAPTGRSSPNCSICSGIE